MSEEKRTGIGMVGIGRMGDPICRRLLAAGYEVQVFSRTMARAEPLLDIGAHSAASLAELAGSSDSVLTCLDTVEACEDVALSPDGVVAHARPGTLLIELSTISPELAVRVARAAANRGLDYADAPVSGGPEGAHNGTLAIMVGGSDAAFARAEPILRTFGKTVVHMGRAGRGMQTKLVNQLLTLVHGAVAAEAIAVAEHAGLDLQKLGAVLGAGFGQSRMLERTLARVASGDFEAGAALQLYRKDVTLLQELSASLGLQLAMGSPAQSMLEQAIDEGLGARDIAALRLRYAPAPPNVSD